VTETVFACFDVETTRLDPAVGRVIEIAVVRIDDQGRPAGDWTTLIDPATADLGRADIHGIQLAWLAEAPVFLEIAGDLVDFLSGCVPVAHNAGFDRGFLCAEWDRAGLGPLNIEAVDTLALAKGLGLPGRLGELTGALDVPLENAHTALGDSRALARVLIELIGRLDSPVPLPRFDPPLLSPPASGLVTHRPVDPI
jgi:DNA polymerase-3 subunit epsilon